MNNYDFEGQPDGDWDDRGDLSWENYDWRGYIARHEDEVERFIDLYNRLKDQPDHLDETARQMGWDTGDWSIADDGDSFLSPSDGFSSEEDDDEEEDGDPYTLLRHPVFVVVRGLYRYLKRMWSHYLAGEKSGPDAKTTWIYAQLLAEGEMHAMMALQSIDTGDYQLAICQIKIVFEDLNRTFTVVPVLFPATDPSKELMEREINVRIFDLREMCLRLISDCTEEIHRRDRSGE
jgi:hypothetical protein